MIETPRAWCLGGILVLLAFGSPRPAVAGVLLPPPLEGHGPLPWRAGGYAAFTLDAAAFPDSAGLALELYLRIPPSTLRALAADSSNTSRIHISAELRSGYSGRRQEAQQELVVAPGDTIGAYGEVVLVRLPAQPGPQRLKVRVEDVLSHNPGLAHVGRRASESATLSGEFDIPAAQPSGQLSDPEFVWEERGRGGSAFQRMGVSLIPNAERLYGLFATDVIVAFAATGPDPARGWHWRVRVLDERKTPLAAAESTATAAARFEARARLDVSRLPAGGYDLELTAWQEGDARMLTRVARFSIAWQTESWSRSAGEMQDLVHFLLRADDEEQFSRMQPGERERWLEDFWRRRDPSPGTAENEARTTFLQRVGIANQRYGRAGLEPGMFSDMGRVFIRYGEPSEIQTQVMPAGDETLTQIVEELTYTENRPVGDVHAQGIGGDIRPYEVWLYEGEIPIPIDADPSIDRSTRHKRLVFLFVDDHGLGDHRLRYSNE